MPTPVLPLSPRSVQFDSGGETLMGRLWLPPDAHAPLLPAIIAVGSWLTVKEQMPAIYAPLLARGGFAALTFDFRGFGESSGEPREVESPAKKAQDIAAAAAWLSNQPQIDAERVGVLAICASAGYAAAASSAGAAIASIALVAPWLHDRGIVEAIYGGTAGVAQRLAQADAAREAFARTGEVPYVKAASNSEPDAAMYMPGDALDYYLNPERGAVPQWGARFALMSWTEWLTFDGIALAPRVRAPTLVVTGDDTATPDGALRFAAALAVPHAVVKLPGSQFDFYDAPATVEAAARAAIDHFRSTLS